MSNPFTSTLLKAFDILSCFDSDGQELGIKEIAQLVDMPQSSVYRIIQSMEFSGFIYQNWENRKYRLGPKLLSLSAKRGTLDSYLNVTIKHMKQLAQDTGETVNLASLDCDHVTYMHRIECTHVLRPNFTLKASYPAHSTALGRVLMADLPTTSLRWIYEKNAAEIGVGLEEFLAQEEQVRQLGYAFDDQEFCQGLRCVAAPVRGPGGKALFSISVSTPTMRMDDANYERTRKLVVRCCAQASAEISEMSGD